MPDALTFLANAVDHLAKRLADLETRRQVSDQAVDTVSSPTFAGLTLTGRLTGYNGLTAVGQGVAPIVAQIDLIGQAAAIAAGTLVYTVPAGGDGPYRLSWYSKVTQAATSSSTLGALAAAYTDATDSSILGVTALGQTLAGASATTNTLNTTSALLTGKLYLWAKGLTNINYSFGYVSSGVTPMQYELHMKLEHL